MQYYSISIKYIIMLRKIFYFLFLKHEKADDKLQEKKKNYKSLPIIII